MPGIGQRVRQEPAPCALDAADDVAPVRLHEQSLPRSGPLDQAALHRLFGTLEMLGAELVVVRRL